MGIFAAIKDIFTPHTSYAKRRENPPVKIGQVKMPPTFPTPSNEEAIHLERERSARKQATALKKQKRYEEAVRFLRVAREEQYKTSFWYDINTLLRIPKYLILAGKFNAAIAEAKELLSGKWNVCGQDTAEGKAIIRQAILDVIEEAAEKSGDESLRSLCAEKSKSHEDNIVKARFTDALKRCRESGYDLARISDSCGECNAECEGLHGRIISVFGGTPGFPKLSDIDAHLLFGGEIGHRIEYIDEFFDGDEIELQRANPVTDFTPHGLERNMYKIEVERYCRKGMMQQDAIIAVARDRLECAIRIGLCVDAVGVVKEMTNAQVLALCPNGRPPTFEPFKATKKEIANGANESFKNGIVCIRREGISSSRIISVCRL